MTTLSHYIVPDSRQSVTHPLALAEGTISFGGQIGAQRT